MKGCVWDASKISGRTPSASGAFGVHHRISGCTPNAPGAFGVHPRILGVHPRNSGCTRTWGAPQNFGLHPKRTPEFRNSGVHSKCNKVLQKRKTQLLRMLEMQYGIAKTAGGHFGNPPTYRVKMPSVRKPARCERTVGKNGTPQEGEKNTQYNNNIYIYIERERERERNNHSQQSSNIGANPKYTLMRRHTPGRGLFSHFVGGRRPSCSPERACTYPPHRFPASTRRGAHICMGHRHRRRPHRPRAPHPAATTHTHTCRRARRPCVVWAPMTVHRNRTGCGFAGAPRSHACRRARIPCVVWIQMRVHRNRTGCGSGAPRSHTCRKPQNAAQYYKLSHSWPQHAVRYCKLNHPWPQNAVRHCKLNHQWPLNAVKYGKINQPQNAARYYKLSHNGPTRGPRML